MTKFNNKKVIGTLKNHLKKLEEILKNKDFKDHHLKVIAGNIKSIFQENSDYYSMFSELTFNQPYNQIHVSNQKHAPSKIDEEKAKETIQKAKDIINNAINFVENHDTPHNIKILELYDRLDTKSKRWIVAGLIGAVFFYPALFKLGMETEKWRTDNEIKKNETVKELKIKTEQLKQKINSKDKQIDSLLIVLKAIGQNTPNTETYDTSKTD